MKFIKNSLKGAYVISLDPFKDNRGFFVRSFCKNEFKEIGHEDEFVQINHSYTCQKGALRGMHYQLPPYAEIKIVRCIQGSVLDIMVDLRKDSPTFLHYHEEILSRDNMKMMYIPKGFAHGFQTLEENCELLYFHTDFYMKSHEGAVRYNDPMIKIKWPLDITDISERDQNHPLLNKDFNGVIV